LSDVALAPAPRSGCGGSKGKVGRDNECRRGTERGGNSVFNVFTSAGPELPRELVLDENGGEDHGRQA